MTGQHSSASYKGGALTTFTAGTTVPQHDCICDCPILTSNGQSTYSTIWAILREWTVETDC